MIFGVTSSYYFGSEDGKFGNHSVKLYLLSIFKVRCSDNTSLDIIFHPESLMLNGFNIITENVNRSHGNKDCGSVKKKLKKTSQINTNKTTFLEPVELLLNSAATAPYRNIYSCGKTGLEGTHICGPMPRISSILLLSVPGLKRPIPSKLPL